MIEPSELKLGRFTVDVGTGELMDGAERVPLRPQTAQLLVLLAGRPGRVVSRDEIRAGLWDDEVLDHESGINACVRELRRALDDDARTPRFVETVPRRGYRLIGVRGPAEPEPPLPPRAPSRRRAAFAAAFLAIALVTALAIRGSTSPMQTVVVLAPTPGTPAPVVAAVRTLIEDLRAQPDVADLRIETQRAGDVFDPVEAALLRADASIPADLLLEPSADAGGLRLYLYRPSDRTMLWTARVPLDSLHASAPVLARALRSAGGQERARPPKEPRLPGP